MVLWNIPRVPVRLLLMNMQQIHSSISWLLQLLKALCYGCWQVHNVWTTQGMYSTHILFIHSVLISYSHLLFPSSSALLLAFTTSHKDLQVSVRKLIASTINRKMHLRGNTSESICFQVQYLPLSNRLFGLKIIQANYFLSSMRLNEESNNKLKMKNFTQLFTSSQWKALFQSQFQGFCSSCDQGLAEGVCGSGSQVRLLQKMVSCQHWRDFQVFQLKLRKRQAGIPATCQGKFISRITAASSHPFS